MDYKKLIYKKAKKLSGSPNMKFEDLIFCRDCDFPKRIATKTCDLCNVPLCDTCSKWRLGHNLDFCRSCEIDRMDEVKKMIQPI